MKPKCFPEGLVATLQREKIIGLRAGAQPHRLIGLWVVVVKGRVFIRSWAHKANSWHRVLQADPRAVLQVGARQFKVRAVHTRSETLKDAVSVAYKEKYNTPGSVQFVKDMSRKKSRDTTTELVPSK